MKAAVGPVEDSETRRLEVQSPGRLQYAGWSGSDGAGAMKSAVGDTVRYVCVSVWV